MARGNRRYCPEHARLVGLLDDRERRRRFREAHSDRVRAERSRRVNFRGERRSVPANPRTGTCSLCGRTRREDRSQFDLHHWAYDEGDPLFQTIELCRACHMYQHGRSARLLRKLLRVEGRTLGAVLTRGDADMVMAEEIASAAP